MGVLGLALGLVVGVAGASIPENGVYTGCYLKSRGALRVIDPSQKCRATETRITWNEEGQPGPPGESAAGALVRTDNWTPTDPGNPVHLTTTDPVTLLSVPKPEGGAWDQAVVIVTMNAGNWLETRAALNCMVPDNAAGTPMIVFLDGITHPLTHGFGGTWTFTTAYSGQGSSVEFRCRIIEPPLPPGTYDVAVNWATLSVIPAVQLDVVVH
jgi:hypothetical protein